MQAFKTKIWRLNETMAKVKTQGGNGVRNLLNKWTTGRYSTWSFKIYYSQFEYDRLKQENNYLKGEKRKLEEDLEVERCQKAKIENKLKETMAKSQEVIGNLKKKVQKANTEI